MSKIHINNNEINVVRENDTDYICLTDMIKAKDGEFFITDWLRNKNTLDFIAVWERLNNPQFNYGEFATITSGAGRNSFKVSIKDLTVKCGARGIISKTGRYGGTYAHKDIAFEFGMWISAEFKLLLITEYQRLKDGEAHRLNQNWDLRRLLTKANYRLQTDAVKDVLIPLKNLPKEKEGFVYAAEADLLYQAMYGYTSKQWKEANPDLALRGSNMRDYASVHQLIVLNGLEVVNAELIRAGLSIDERFTILRKSAIQQLKSLQSSKSIEDADEQSPNKLMSISTKGDRDKTDI